MVPASCRLPHGSSEPSATAKLAVIPPPAASPRSRFLLTAAATLAVLAGAVVTYVSFAERNEDAPEATPRPGLAVTASEIRVVPDDVMVSRRAAAAAELSKTLRAFYTRAFFASPSLQRGDDLATPRPTRWSQLRESMTKSAFAALERSPGVFDAGELVVFEGTLTFGGLVTFGSAKPAEALLDVDLVARAAPAGDGHPIAKVHQTGTIRMTRTSTGWLVDGFDLRFESRPLPTPTAAPS